MRVDTVGDVLYSMAEDALCRELVCAFAIEPGRAGVAALMRRMMTSRRIHDAAEPRQELMIRERPAVIVSDECDAFTAHPVLIVW